MVPDTLLEGTDADQIFNVTAADVSAFLGTSSPTSTFTDYYSFTGQAGTLINLQIFSTVLSDFEGAFASTLSLYYFNPTTGQDTLVAYNNSSFQDKDSWILDCTLPSTGTYYVAVGANPAAGVGQSGAYNLFIYTFAEAADPTAGDTMYAGSGDDTIVGGPADDMVLSHFPQDTFAYGSGAIDFTDTAPFFNLTVGANRAASEGAPVTLDASFVDFDNADTLTYDWHVVSSNGQEIADGTGPSFTFTPDDAGTYTVTYTVDGQEGSGTTQVVVTSEAVPPTLTAPSAAQNAGVTEGSVATVDLGTLTAAGIGPWTVTVEWGDGQSSTFTTTSTGPLTDTHDYTSPGEESIYVVVSEAYGDSTSLSFSVGVLNAATTTAIGMPTSVTYSQSATVTATVSGAGTPTGTVLLYLGAVNPADQVGSGTLSVVGGQDEVTFATPTTLHVSGSPYTLTAVYEGDGSHQASQQSISLTITPYAFTYQIGNDTQIAGAPANLAADLGTTIPTGVNGQDLGIAYSSTGDAATANVVSGGYAITGSPSGGTGLMSDYSVTLKNGTLTVNPYAFTYQIGTAGQTYGTAVILSSKLGTTIPTGVGGQTLDIAYTSSGDTATANAGSYSIMGTLSGGTGLLSNYSVTLKYGTLTVNPYAFTYQIGNDAQTYGTAANLASALGTTIPTGVNGQTLDIAYSSSGDATTADAGTYAINGRRERRHRPVEQLQCDAEERHAHRRRLCLHLPDRQRRPDLRHRGQPGLRPGHDHLHRRQRPDARHRLQQHRRHRLGRGRDLSHQRDALQRHGESVQLQPHPRAGHALRHAAAVVVVHLRARSHRGRRPQPVGECERQDPWHPCGRLHLLEPPSWPAGPPAPSPPAACWSRAA